MSTHEKGPSAGGSAGALSNNNTDHDYATRLNVFLPLDLSDFEVKDNLLTELQHLIFLRLVKQFWLTACPLPTADTMLARIARVSTSEWRRNREAVLVYFTETPKGLEPDLYADALRRAQGIAEKRREAGRKGGKSGRRSRRAFASKNASNCFEDSAPKPDAKRQAIASKNASKAKADTDTGTETSFTTCISSGTSPQGPDADADFPEVSGGAA